MLIVAMEFFNNSIKDYNFLVFFCYYNFYMSSRHFVKLNRVV
ncbi:hypothetical protein G436_0702 [Leptospira interrogans serovar Hardjo str. Norma]|uniref:Uncharacterized protein n=1 Tax=Leptospira interrogans serovar Hardjo str. Norma TaxID=1279460 RepID=A0A0M3TKU3_LEPIR|nr:hypothetical protein G436_0702 [Leptospira interrogans serovar Hardjo str. Norma]